MDEYMITALEKARTGAREGGIPIGGSTPIGAESYAKAAIGALFTGIRR